MPKKVSAKDGKTIARLWNKICQQVDKYPKDNLDVGRVQCLKVKNGSKKTYKIWLKGKPKTVTPYAIGFMFYHNVYPLKRFKHISHKCGNIRNKKRSMCIEGRHMKLESPLKNRKRQKCHKFIRDYVSQFSKINCEYATRTTGTITVDDINAILNANDIDNLQGYINRVQCNCDESCFINFGIDR